MNMRSNIPQMDFRALTRMQALTRVQQRRIWVPPRFATTTIEGSGVLTSIGAIYATFTLQFHYYD